MTISELKELCLHAARKTAPANYAVENVDSAVADAFREMTGSVNDFLRNQYDIFEIMIETVDKVVPQKVMDAMSAFAEVRQVGQGETVMFKRGGLGRLRAKKFLTQVGLSGVYEAARLDNETFTIGMKSIGGAITMDFERFLDGAESLAELMDVLAEAQEDGIYQEVQKALMAAKAQMPARNKKIGSYAAADLQKIVNTVKAYGGTAVIAASPEFIDAMGPDAIVPAIAGVAQGIYSPEDIAAIHNSGRVKIFRGTPIVEFKQSFLDENNDQIMIHPQYAYVLPGSDKIVKVVLEGATQMWTLTNADQSVEVESYKKIGVGIVTFNNWGIYQNTDISAADWYSEGGIDGLDGILPQLNP